MPSSDYNKVPRRHQGGQRHGEQRAFAADQNELIANYGLMDDDVDYLLRQFRYNV